MKRWIIAALCALWLAMLLLGGAGAALDELLLGALYGGDRPGLAAVARLLTELGGYRVLVPATVLAALWLLLQRRARAASTLLLIVLGGRFAVDLQKLAIARLRPDLHEPLVPVVSSSFPSGHSANALITWGAIALLLGRGRGWIAAAALLAVLSGLSRPVLGVHWPSDVVGGWAFGTLWLVAWAQLARNAAPASVIDSAKESRMTDNTRAQTPRDNDDSELIDSMEDAPSQGGASGGNLQRDIASRAEQQHDVDGKPGITRVQDKDKPEEANLPRFNDRN